MVVLTQLALLLKVKNFWPSFKNVTCERTTLLASIQSDWGKKWTHFFAQYRPIVPFVSYHYIFSFPNSEHVQVDDQKKPRKSTLKVHFSPIRTLNCMYICLVHLLAALCSAALSNSIVGAENTKQRKACNQFENQANIFHQNVPSTTFLWAGPPAFNCCCCQSLLLIRHHQIRILRLPKQLKHRLIKLIFDCLPPASKRKQPRYL